MHLDRLGRLPETCSCLVSHENNVPLFPCGSGGSGGGGWGGGVFMSKFIVLKQLVVFLCRI